MSEVWASFEKSSGKILMISYGHSTVETDINTLHLKIPDYLAKKYIIDQRPIKVKNDLRIVSKNETIVDIININKNIKDLTNNKFIEIPYFYKNVIPKVDVMMVIKSLDFKPVLEIKYLSEKEMLSDSSKNRLLIHLTEKRNIHGHYQTFDIDLRKFMDCESIIFDIDRCDYQKLFDNKISFYYRKSLDIAYTIK